jgi:hypothetical protein
MKGKLIKKDGHYFLEVKKYTWHPINKFDEIIANTFEKSQGTILQLSFKNCEAIELGHDLDTLADRAFASMGYHSTVTPHEEKQFKLGYRVAFREAFDLFGDKNKNLHEWDVEVEMDRIPADRAPEGWEVFPRLDSKGCLILKRV